MLTALEEAQHKPKEEHSYCTLTRRSAASTSAPLKAYCQHHPQPCQLFLMPTPASSACPQGPPAFCLLLNYKEGASPAPWTSQHVSFSTTLLILAPLIIPLIGCFLFLHTSHSSPVADCDLLLCVSSWSLLAAPLTRGVLVLMRLNSRGVVSGGISTPGQEQSQWVVRRGLRFNLSPATASPAEV